MRRCTRLKIAILQGGSTQREIAKRAKIDEGLFSLICTGRYNPDEIQKAKIAQALEKPESTIFDSV